MTKRQILQELNKYLNDIRVIELSIAMAVPRSVGICMNITDIIKEYNSTQENEDIVCDLLSQLCRIHFKKSKSLTPSQPDSL